jgi:hypothetical protein
LAGALAGVAEVDHAGGMDGLILALDLPWLSQRYAQRKSAETGWQESRLRLASPLNAPAAPSSSGRSAFSLLVGEKLGKGRR